MRAGDYRPDHQRVNRHVDPRLGTRNPAEPLSQANANVTINKTAAPLGRAGAGPGSPILAGLGDQQQFQLSSDDLLTGVYLFQDPAAIGLNLKSTCSTLAAYLYGLDILAGSGQTVAGSPATGAARNFLRIVSRRGTVDKEFWIKSIDADVVTVKTQATLDPATLDPVPVTDAIASLGSGAWHDIAIGFFASWIDEMGQPGYGGAAFVSLFDTDTATEGVGGDVEPVNQQPIATVSSMRLSNTPGLKRITARFRSKIDSVYFVDVPFEVLLTYEAGGVCLPPVIDPCSDVLLKHGASLPNNTPAAASVEGYPTEAGAFGSAIVRDLLIIAVRAAAVGDSPTLFVRRWTTAPSGTDLSGAQAQQGADSEYIPLALASDSPAMGSPYQAPQILAIALDVGNERLANVAALTVQVKDGELLSEAVFVVGPKLRDIAFYPPGEAGGGSGCCGPAGCVADDDDLPDPST